MIVMTCAGVIPLMRDAAESDDGRARISFSFASADSPPRLRSKRNKRDIQNDVGNAIFKEYSKTIFKKRYSKVYSKKDYSKNDIQKTIDKNVRSIVECVWDARAVAPEHFDLGLLHGQVGRIAAFDEDALQRRLAEGREHRNHVFQVRHGDLRVLEHLERTNATLSESEQMCSVSSYLRRLPSSRTVTFVFAFHSCGRSAVPSRSARIVFISSSTRP